MKCYLCLEEKELLKKSHIIPNFMYEGLFDEKHFMAKVEVESWKITGKLPNGVYDKNILCAKCDNQRIGSLETYGSKILKGGAFSKEEQPTFQVRNNENVTIFDIQKVDYVKFKLFLLSILWRGHISKHEFFESIDLGPYAEKIRLMLMAGNPGKDDELETGLINYDSKLLSAKSLIAARKFKMANNSCYLIHIKSLSIIFKISNQENIDLIKTSTIKTNNTLSIFYLQNEKAASFFQRLTGLKETEKTLT